MFKNYKGNLEIAKDIVYNSIPAFGCMLCFESIEVINIAAISSLNEHVLVAAVGQGNALLNIVCFGIFYGIKGPLVTIGSQAIGASQPQMCGVYR